MVASYPWMTSDSCFAHICFVALDPSAPKFFGFAEFLAALALMVLAWTTTDIRYQFRIATAALPLKLLTFLAVAAVGLLTLLTDLWRAEGWPVPKGNVLTPGIWQGILGGIFFLTFLLWAWFAFINPPTFGKRSAKRFGNYLFRKISEGSPAEMTILAQELIRSIPALVATAPNFRKREKSQTIILTDSQGIANDIFLLLGDARFCRAMVASSPGTIFALFQEMKLQNKFNISVSQVARNVVIAAIDNKNSFLYHEDEGYESGLLGYLKPISQAIFGNFRMVEDIDTLFEGDYRQRRKWTSQEWDAFNRAVLITLEDYVRNDFWSYSFVLARSFEIINEATADLYKIDGADANWDHDSIDKLQGSVDFCRKALKILDAAEPRQELRWRLRKGDPFHYRTIFDVLVELIFEILKDAATIKRPWDLSWSVQHNIVWSEFFGGLVEEGKATKVVQFKLRRLIFDEILSASRWPNFSNVKMLGYCLNVMGLELSLANIDRHQRPLQKALLSWTKRNYVSLEAKAPNVFEDCLPAGLSYDKKNCRLVRTFEANASRSKPEYCYFNLDRPVRRRTSAKSHALRDAAL